MYEIEVEIWKEETEEGEGVRKRGGRLMTSNLIRCMTDRCRYEEEDIPRDTATVQYTFIDPIHQGSNTS